MKIGVPKEIKEAEKRVALTPSCVRVLSDCNHKILVEKGAGLGSGFRDEEYVESGATMLDRDEDVWSEADMIVKVKEPLGPEFERIKPGQVLFTYLHLAADSELTTKLMKRGIVGIAYETVQLDDGTLPLLAPMSEVAGALSIQMGAFCLEAKNGGLGILLSGVPGVKPARVTILGGGVAGFAAARLACGLGAQVSVLDVNLDRLRYIRDVTNSRVLSLYSSPANIEAECVKSDLVIGSVLIPGAKAPKLITRSLLKKMKPGAAFVDISVDQGGCAETTKPTTHTNPIFVEEGIVHYCVANMPGAVPRTSTIALSNATFKYVLSLANKGWKAALADDPALRRGLNVLDCQITYRPVAECFGLPCILLEL